MLPAYTMPLATAGVSIHSQSVNFFHRRAPVLAFKAYSPGLPTYTTPLATAGEE